MKIPPEYHIRTFGFKKNCSENNKFQAELSKTLGEREFNSVGFKKFLNLFFERYENRKRGALVLRLNSKQINPPVIGDFYHILGPRGIVEDVTESLRSAYIRENYAEDPELGDSFSHLYPE